MGVTVSKITAGEGYKYFTEQVTKGDERRPGVGMAEYFGASGNPPGRWLGSGVEALRRIAPLSEEIGEEEMCALFGNASHPALLELMEQGRSDEALLGARWAEYTDGRHATAGYDMTFSPVKSVSVLWACGGEEWREKIYWAHRHAVENTMAWVDQEIALTRLGRERIVTPTQGLVAQAWDHLDSRNGDPQLHTHVSILNKTCCHDGRWRAIDGREVYGIIAAAGQRYDLEIACELTRLGLHMTAREMGEDKLPIYEIAEVPPELCEEFSTRRRDIERRAHYLLDKYRTDTGVEPTRRQVKKIYQQATLETRKNKKTGLQAADKFEEWTLRSDTILARPDRRRVSQERIPVWDEAYRGEVVDQVMRRLEERRSTWNERNIETELYAAFTGYQWESSDQWKQEEAIVGREIAARCRVLTTGSEARWGSTLATVYSTDKIIEAEQKALDAADELILPKVEQLHVRDALTDFHASHSFRLSIEQQEFAYSLATGERLLTCGVGAAGAGKTATMEIVAGAFDHAGAQLYGVAPSAKAAGELQASLGRRCLTVDRLTRAWRGELSGIEAGSVAGLGVEVKPGDAILIDEAGMVSSQNFATLVDIARATDTRLIAIGDPYQLGAVEGASIFHNLLDRTPATSLTQVMRFGQDKEQAENSLALRLGKDTSLGMFYERGWVHEGSKHDMIASIVDAYSHAEAAGESFVALATTRETVHELNVSIQQERIQKRLVAGEGVPMRLHDGSIAWVGDTIVTRKNVRSLASSDGMPVANRELWRITRIRPDGGVDAVNLGRGVGITLPGDYVAHHVELGYAHTVHAAQGMTVDRSATLVDDNATRQLVYVGATRGRRSNDLFVNMEPTRGRVGLDANLQDRTSRDLLEGVLACGASPQTAVDVMEDARRQHTRHQDELSEALSQYRSEVDTIAAERVETGVYSETLAARTEASRSVLLDALKHEWDVWQAHQWETLLPEVGLQDMWGEVEKAWADTHTHAVEAVADARSRYQAGTQCAVGETTRGLRESWGRMEGAVRQFAAALPTAQHLLEEKREHAASEAHAEHYKNLAATLRRGVKKMEELCPPMVWENPWRRGRIVAVEGELAEIEAIRVAKNWPSYHSIAEEKLRQKLEKDTRRIAVAQERWERDKGEALLEVRRASCGMDQADKEREERLAALKERGRVLGAAQVERVKSRAPHEEIMAGNADIDAIVAEELRLEHDRKDALENDYRQLADDINHDLHTVWKDDPVLTHDLACEHAALEESAHQLGVELTPAQELTHDLGIEIEW